LAVALLTGSIWGTAGRSRIARAVQTSELRSELLGARAAVLDGRVAIHGVTLRRGRKHLEGARGLLGRADERLKRLGRDDELKHVQLISTSAFRLHVAAGVYSTRSRRRHFADAPTTVSVLVYERDPRARIGRFS